MGVGFAARQDAGFLRCWSLQDCKGCLGRPGCSWCPFTWSCVPNNYSVPALAPAWDEDICPHWAERWELRTRPLGCQVSTITSLTAVVSVASTLAVLLLLLLLVVASRRLRAYHAKNPDWWRVWQHRWARRRPARSSEGGGRPGPDEEHEPLLPP